MPTVNTTAAFSHMFPDITTLFTPKPGFRSRSRPSASSASSALSSTTVPCRIIDQMATPYYWYHLCLKDTKVYTPLDFGLEAIPHSSCSHCGYVPRHDTILTNEEYQPVETLAGKNLLAQRFTPYLVRCGNCHQTTKNYLPAHPEFNKPDAEELWPGDEQCNNCWHFHASDFTTYDPTKNIDFNIRRGELVCRGCTIVNPFGEDFIMFLKERSVGGEVEHVQITSIMVRGGPLDRHQKALKAEWEIELMQRREFDAGRNKRKTEAAGYEQGRRDPRTHPTMGTK